MQLASVGRQAFTKFLRQNPLMFSSSPSSGGQGQPNSNPKLNMCSTKIVNSHPPQLLQSQSLLHHEESHNNNPIEKSHNNFSSQVLSLNTRKLSKKGDPKAPLNLLQGQVLSYFRPFQSRDLSNLLKYNRGGAVFSKPEGEANIPTTLSTRNVHMLTLGKINDEDKTFETVTLAEMKRFFRKYEIPFEDGYTCLRVDCFFCKKATRKKKSFFWDSDKLYVNKTTGYFVCINCKISGTWKNLQDLIILFKSGQGFTKTSLDHLKKDEPISKFEEKLNDLQMNSQEISTLTSEEWSEIALRFGLEKLKKPVLEQYEMRYNKDEDYILLPIYNVELKRIGYQIFKISSKSGVLEANTVPKSCKEIFGWKPVIHTISSNSVAKSKPIILVQSALDALSVASGSTYLPLGLHPDCNHLPQEFLPQLEHFNDIILWFGNDVKSWESAKAFGRKLEEKRCKLLRPMDLNPSPFLALQQDLNLNKILTAAQPMEHKAITTFSKLRDEVLSELNHQDQVAGVKWTRFPYLTKLLKGHRRGELTVLTGSTGSGKTTFVSEYSLDLCIHGVNTLWGSFEIRNVRLAKTMLTQFSETNLETHIDEYDKWADKFEKLPLYFMTFHGQQSVKAVLDAMTHAAYVYDIGHVVVDNLQFMLGVSEGSGHLDRFWRQDLIVAAFRKFATVNNCHVTLVMHPRKEGTDTELSNSSIFGGAKASQEADNILILQDKRLTSPRGKKYLQVSKNRFSGDLGMFTLEFNRECLSFATKKKPRSDQSIIVKPVTDNNDDRKDSSEINDHNSNSKISDHAS